MKKSFLLISALVMVVLFTACSDDDKESGTENHGTIVSKFNDLSWFLTSTCYFDSNYAFVGFSIGITDLCKQSEGIVYLEAISLDDARGKVLELLPPEKEFTGDKVILQSEDGSEVGTLMLKENSDDSDAFAELIVSAEGSPLKVIRFINPIPSLVFSPYVAGDVVLITWDKNLKLGYDPPCIKEKDVCDTIYYASEATIRSWETTVYHNEDGKRIVVDPNQGPLFWVCLKPATSSSKGILAHIHTNKASNNVDNSGYATSPMGKKVSDIYRSNMTLYTKYFCQVCSPDLKDNKIKDPELWTSDFSYGFIFDNYWTIHLDDGKIEKYGWSHPNRMKLRVFEFDSNGKLYPNMRNVLWQ